MYEFVLMAGLVLTAIVSIIVLRKMPSSQQWVGILIASAGLGQRGYVVCQYIVQEAPILIHMYVVCFSCIGRDHTGTHD